MKKLMMGLLCTAVFALSACSSNIKATDTRAKMEKAGYTVTLSNADEAKTRYASFEYNVTITDALYAKKDKDLLFAVYCNNKDDAAKFVQDNIAQLALTAEILIENPQTGSHNNVAYVGSETSVSLAGLK